MTEFHSTKEQLGITIDIDYVKKHIKKIIQKAIERGDIIDPEPKFEYKMKEGDPTTILVIPKNEAAIAILYPGRHKPWFTGTSSINKNPEEE